MSTGLLYYLSGLAILLGINLIAIWGLDLQFGLAGINNFAYVVFQAAGGYAAALVALKPASAYGSFETYVGGFSLPFPLPLIAAALTGALLAVPIGLIAMRRLRADYQAMAMLVLSLIATGVASAQTGLVNGPTGLALIPARWPGHWPSHRSATTGSSSASRRSAAPSPGGWPAGSPAHRSAACCARCGKARARSRRSGGTRTCCG